ncbi:acetyl-CoA carboxylase, carboxyl transferase subunit alpha [Rhodococcus ruber BKS 20-38]|uniref:acetyl-CoA carboxytransferase n=1 Tax=Rhodococcus ruber BKS 20-38 TaxID=1278076 RepID=M3A4C5_9NOCA|nr:acetyl-CoA carboxylase, carboxyl transferase subunit alpha [Rhodococcus ruber BKS 20-38]
MLAVLGVESGGPLHVPSDRARRPDSTSLPAHAWDVVTRCRSADRPSGLEWAGWLAESWVELRGPDPAVRAGFAIIGGHRTVVIAMDRHARNVGQTLPGPEAFRLAQRAIELAGRLSLPVVTIVDTPGADPGPESETGGIAAEIARTLLALAGLPTVSVCLVVGEGGSGGAMALAHTDSLLMLEGSIFSVISPESGAAVLYRDRFLAPNIAVDFQMTAPQLVAAGIADRVLREDLEEVSESVARALSQTESGARNRRTDAVTASALGAHR